MLAPDVSKFAMGHRQPSILSPPLASGDFIVGNLANSVGTVIVDGLGSMLIAR